MNREKYINTFCRLAAVLSSNDKDADKLVEVLDTNPTLDQLVLANDIVSLQKKDVTPNPSK